MKITDTKIFSKEYIFILLILLFIFLILIFNYLVDPYYFFSKKEYPDANFLPRDLIYPYIHKYRNKKFDTLILGSSQSITIYKKEYWAKHNAAILAFADVNYKFLYEILKKYIATHPETKTIVVGIEQPILFNDKEEIINDNSYNHIENISRLLFSYATTKASIKAFPEKIKLLSDKYQEYKKEKNLNISLIPAAYADNINNKEAGCIIDSFPYLIDIFEETKYSKELMEFHYKYLDKIIELAKENNIECKFIMLPVHASALEFINGNEDLKHIITDIKFYLADKNIDFYDMQFVNKYTEISLFDKNNCLWHDRLHPYPILGIEVFKTLFDENESDKELYFKITKDNLPDIMEQEQILLADYIKNNKQDLESYKNLIASRKFEQTRYIPFCKYLDGICKELTNKNYLYMLKQNKVI